jgi:Uma2 family endonuclease
VSGVASTAPTLHRLDPDVYDRMVDSGALAGQPVELVDGLLIHVTPQGSQHAALIHWLMQRLAARLDLLRVQMPLAVPGGRPEPDLALAETNAREHPRTAHLVVEVMVTAHAEAYAKLPGYADAGVPVAWLVDVPARAVHVFAEPRGRAFDAERVLTAGDVLDAPVDGVAPIDVGALFGVLDD